MNAITGTLTCVNICFVLYGSGASTGVEVNRNLIPCRKSVDVHFMPRLRQLSLHLFSYTLAYITLLDGTGDWGPPWGPRFKMYMREADTSLLLL